MSKKPIVRASAAILGGIAVAVCLLGFLVIANAGSGLAGSAATTALGWTLPLIAGGLVGVASWLLLNGHENEDENPELRSSSCDVCGGRVMEEWRLCPNCGTIIDRSVRAPATSERAVV